MTETIALALIVTVPPTLTAVAALVVGLRTKQEVGNVHKIVNSQNTVLLARVAHALARIAEITQEATDVEAAREANRDIREKLEREKLE